MFTGPGEVIFMSLVVLAFKATFGLGVFAWGFSFVAPHLVSFLNGFGMFLYFREFFKKYARNFSFHVLIFSRLFLRYHERLQHLLVALS